MTNQQSNNKGFLSINAGSSSLKFALYVATEDTPVMVGLCERIGSDGAVKLKDQAGQPLSLPEQINLQDHKAAMGVVLDALRLHFPAIEVVAAGHRVVHGGDYFDGPVVIDEQVLATIESLIPLSPLHQPHNLSGIYAAREAFPEIPQIVCFDTAFHRGQTFEHQAFAIPYMWYQKGIKRYGFHGLSYDYINSEIQRLEPQAHQGKVVVAHLGNGSSLCAIEGGRSKASSMGFTVLDGLPMGTRCGQIDPGVLLHFLQGEGMSVSEVSQLLYHQSGLLGLSDGLSNDMRSLAEAGTEASERAIAYFTTKVREGIAAMTAAMQGVDLIVFTAGIGENSPQVREQVCQGLEWLGVDFDPARNAAVKGQAVISTDTSQVKVMVIPTNEELVIARAARALFNA